MSLVRRLWYWLNRGRFEDALRREMEGHRAMMHQPAQFGNLLRLREESVDAWGGRWIEQTIQDVRFGFRTLLKNRGFAATAVLTLALATGATTAIFSVVNSVLLRPLPFAEPDRLVQVYGRNWSQDRGDRTPDPMTAGVRSPELYAYETQSASFEQFAGYFTTIKHLDGPIPERLTAVVADLEFFSMLGVDAAVGRAFRAGDPLDVAVISTRLWDRRFNRDPQLPGRTIVLDGKPHVILGILPDAFQFPYGAASIVPGALPESRTDIWIPSAPLRTATGLRQGAADVTARLKAGVAIDTARAELNLIAARVEAENPQLQRKIAARIMGLSDEVTKPVRRSLWMLFAGVGLVLAAACANVANMLLARMTIRTREVATRAALGASRLRLIRQFLSESLLLSCAGGVAGAFVARWGTGLLVSLAAAKIPRAHEIALDWRAFAFLTVASVVVAILFGLAPAMTAARVDLQTITKDAGGLSTLGPGYARLRDALVVVEVALAFILAVGAALLMGEVARLQRVDKGILTDNVMTFHLTPGVPAADYYAIEQRVSQLPAVVGAGFTQLVPLQNWGWDAEVSIAGREQPGRTSAGLRYVTPGFFGTLGIPLLRGRGFEARDSATAPKVVVVNQTFVRRYLHDEEPIGREIRYRGTIVGVIGDIRQVGLGQPAEPELFYPAAQNVTMAPDLGMSLVVRTSSRPEAIIDLVRGAVRDVNPRLAIFNVKSMDQVVADSLWELNLYRWLIGLFAGLAVLLGAIGLYGVMSVQRHLSPARVRRPPGAGIRSGCAGATRAGAWCGAHAAGDLSRAGSRDGARAAAPHHLGGTAGLTRRLCRRRGAAPHDHVGGVSIARAARRIGEPVDRAQARLTSTATSVG